MTIANPASTGVPPWYGTTAGFGLLWDAYGAKQFMASLNATEESRMESGMTTEPAQVMPTYPALMTLAFAIGVFAARGAPQVIVLSIVVAIAAGLFWQARHGARVGHFNRAG